MVLDLDIFNEMAACNILRRTQKREYEMSHDFKSLLAENVEQFKELDKRFINDHGPALVQTIKDFFNRPMTKQEIHKCLDILMPMIKSKMGGVTY